MKSNTQSVTLNCNPKRAFEFLANPENLPKWATSFCRDIRLEGDIWIAETPQGQLEIRYVTDAELGVIDYYISPAPGIEMIAPSRIVQNTDGAEYIFTQFQPTGMPDEVFQAQIEALKEELEILRRII